MIRTPIDRAAAARNGGRGRTKRTELRVDLEQISITRSHEPEGCVSAKTASRICCRATASTHGTSTDFSPPSEAGRRPCRSPTRMASSFGVPGATRDVVLLPKSRPESKRRWSAVQQALSARSEHARQDQHREVRLLLARSTPALVKSRRMLCSRVHQRRAKQAARVPVVVG